MSTKKPQSHKKKQLDPQMRRALESAKKALARRAARQRELTIRRSVYIVLAAILVLLTGFWFVRNFTKAALHHKIIAESDHYEVTAAMFACYFRQNADSYLHSAAGSQELSAYNPERSMKEQEHSSGETWYDFFTARTMTGVKNTLQLCEAAYRDGFRLNNQQLARCRAIAAQDDLSRYQKGVRLKDLEKAMELTLLAQEYQNTVRAQITITDEEISSYYQAHQTEYLTASVLCYSFPWNPETTQAGDTAEYDAAVNAANSLSNCRTQQEFTDAVYRYLTEKTDTGREKAEQIAGDLTMTKFVREYPAAVQDWLRGNAARGDTLQVPKNDQCCISVYFLREEPKADDTKTVDFRVIALSSADHGEKPLSFAKELMQEIEKEKEAERAQAFSDYAYEFSEDAGTYANGGLVTGYSAVRTTYGDEAAAWLFDRERQHGDMTAAEHDGTALLLFFEGLNEKTGWENQVREDIFSSRVSEFVQECTQYEIDTKEKNYRYLDV